MFERAEFIRKSIRQLNQYFEKSIQKKAERTGLTGPQVRVIEEVVKHQGISIKKLVQNLKMTQSTVSDIVERLVSKGILTKESKASDKRFVEIRPSDAVTKFMHHDRQEYVNESVVEVLNRLSPDELETVSEGIRLLVSAIDSVQKGRDI